MFALGSPSTPSSHSPFGQLSPSSAASPISAVDTACRSAASANAAAPTAGSSDLAASCSTPSVPLRIAVQAELRASPPRHRVPARRSAGRIAASGAASSRAKSPRRRPHWRPWPGKPPIRPSCRRRWPCWPVSRSEQQLSDQCPPGVRASPPWAAGRGEFQDRAANRASIAAPDRNRS